MSTDVDPDLHDDGAQPERTALAWSRTALASAAVFGLVVRLMAPEHPVMAMTFLIAGIPAIVGTSVAARDRFRLAHRAFGVGGPPPDARLAAACALLATLAGLGAGYYVAFG